MTVEATRVATPAVRRIPTTKTTSSVLISTLRRLSSERVLGKEVKDVGFATEWEVLMDRCAFTVPPRLRMCRERGWKNGWKDGWKRKDNGDNINTGFFI
jgi:hypothetical protein